MTKNLIPTPVVDKNGKLTTVHKKPAGASLGADKLAGVPPVTSSAPAPVVEALTAEQAEEFLSSFCPIVIASDLSGSSRYAVAVARTFNALSGETQAVLKRLHDNAALDNVELMDVVGSFGEEFQGYGRTSGATSRMAEPVLRSSAKVFETAMSRYPKISNNFSPAGLFDYSKQVLLGCMDRAVRRNVRFDPCSDEGMENVMAVFSFLMKGDGSRIRESSFADDQGHGHRCVLIDNEMLADFVDEHPDIAELAGDFMKERNLNDSEADIRFMMNHFADTAEAPSISSGRL
jgi:hypothetical protein